MTESKIQNLKYRKVRLMNNFLYPMYLHKVQRPLPNIGHNSLDQWPLQFSICKKFI